MRKMVGLALLVLSMMIMMLGMALVGFERVALDEHRYNRYQEALDLYDSVGVSKDELQAVQHHMSDYLSGTATPSELNQVVTMFGVEQPIFNEREMAHMEDVQSLFALERRVRNGSLISSLVLLGLSLAWIRRGRIMGYAGLMALALWLVVGAVLAALCGFDFEAAFLRFHELLFTNDLWLLNPATDAMIRMYPARFFQWMARDIAVAMGLCALIPALLPFLLRATMRREA